MMYPRPFDAAMASLRINCRLRQAGVHAMRKPARSKFGVSAPYSGDAYASASLRSAPCYAARSAISFFVSAIAFAGFSPFGHTLAQFMIVWQR